MVSVGLFWSEVDIPRNLCFFSGGGWESELVCTADLTRGSKCRRGLAMPLAVGHFIIFYMYFMPKIYVLSE